MAKSIPERIRWWTLSEATAKTWKTLLQASVIIAAGWWIYAPVLHGGWLMDDDFYLSGNFLLHDPARLWKAWFAPGSFIEYYPVEQSVQWMQWELWHGDTLGYHLTNLFLHLLSSLLFWRLLHELGLRWAWLGGLIFAIHPATVESVAWISELKNTLSLPPFLLAMIFYLKFEQNGKRRDYLLALGCFVLAMWCKISMASFPLVILLYGWWKRGRIDWNDVKNSAPFFVVSVGLGLLSVYSGIWYGMASPAGAEVVPLGGFLSRLALAGLSISFYFWNCVWPVGLLPIYPQWVVNPPSLMQFLPWPVLAGIFYGLWLKRQSWGRHALLGTGFFLILLGPFVTINVGGYTKFTWVMDHFLYIPMLGVIGLGVAILGKITDRLSPALRIYGAGILAVLLTGLMVESHAYAGKFVSQEALWTYTLRYNPNSWMVHNNLGGAYAAKGEFDAAMSEYQQAVALNADCYAAYNNIGVLLSKTGQSTQAMAQYQKALAINPHYADAYDNLGEALHDEGRLDEAIGNYKRALALNPNSAMAHYNLGNVYSQEGQMDEAIDQYEKALEIDPDSADTHNNLGKALFQTGQETEAIFHFQKALEINPQNADAHCNLGLALFQAGQVDASIAQSEKALELDPMSAAAHNNLGIALFHEGQKDEAMAHFQRALEINPNYADAHNSLGIALIQRRQPDLAIAQFQEALRLKPGDANARRNLELAQAEVAAHQKADHP